MPGALTGYYGGVVDEVLMRINDAIFAFPSILLALVFISIFGSGKYHVIIALGIAFIPSFARIVRSEFIKCKNMDYVKSAKLQGAGDFRIMFVHILPNTLTVLLSAIMIGFNTAVVACQSADNDTEKSADKNSSRCNDQSRSASLQHSGENISSEIITAHEMFHGNSCKLGTCIHGIGIIRRIKYTDQYHQQNDPCNASAHY